MEEIGLFELKDLQIPRVDAVRWPAVRKKFLVLKEVNGMEKAKLTEEDIEDIKEALKLLYPLWEEGKLPDALIAQLSQIVGYPAPSGAYPSPYPCPSPYPVQGSPTPAKGAAAEKESMSRTESEGGEKGMAETAKTEKKENVVQTPEAAVTPSTVQELPLVNTAKSEKKPEMPPASESVALEKADREYLLKELSTAKKQLAELEAILKAERRARQLLEKTALVEKEFAGLPMPAGELADLLLDIEERFKDDPRLPKFIDTLKKAAGMIRASEALKSAGVSTSATSSSAALELEQKAQQLLKEGKARTPEEARALVLKADKDLFERYRMEVRS